MQRVEPTPEYPWEQTQALRVLEPIPDVLALLAQDTHTLTPDEREYWPIGQFKQLDRVVAPVLLWYVPARHAMQVEAKVIPIPELYVPDRQAVQTELRVIPTPDLYVPAPQEMQ